MWAEWCKNTFGPTFNYNVFVPSIRTPRTQRDHAAIAKAIEATKPLALMLDERIGEDGIRRCAIVSAHGLIRTQSAPRRAFQGWRYLKSDEAPADLGDAGLGMPATLRAELANLGLL